MPSRWTMRRTASRAVECARLDSTWARVERVINGYLLGKSGSQLCVSHGEGRWRWSSAGVVAYVKTIERIPPPAPASACAMLSLCWMAVEGAGAGAGFWSRC